MSFPEDRAVRLAAYYRKVPHARAYHNLEAVMAPYVTIGQSPAHDSPVVRTDANGFRVSVWRGRPVDTCNYDDHRADLLVVGGSFVFGVGATSDAATLASCLAGALDRPALNLGIRAGNSTQELIATIPFLRTARRVVVASGVNNLVAALQSHGQSSLYGPMFFEGAVELFANWPIRKLAATIREVTRGGASDREIARAWKILGRQRLGQGIDRPHGSETADTTAASRLAMQRQVRDLEIITSAIGGPANVVFCAQPFASTDSRRNAQEMALFELLDELQGEEWSRSRRLLDVMWSQYVQGLERACAERGIAFVGIDAARLEGWSFIDRVHLTDDGYAQSARQIAETLVD